MGTAAIAPRHERRVRRFEPFERGDDVFAAADPGRIGLGSDEHEVVVHHRVAFDAVAFGEERLLGRASVHEDDIRVAAAGDVERLAGAQCDDMDFDAGLPLVDW